MRTRLLLALTAVFAIAMASSASALLGTNTNLTTKAAAPSSSSSGGNGSTSGIHDTRGTQYKDCGNGRSITYTGPTEIWPPNHKMRDYTIVAKGNSDDSVTLMTVVSSSQPLNGAGDGNTDEDYVDNTPAGADMGQGQATNTGQVRGERSGTDKAGRTYTFMSHATFDGESCDATFTAHVPHDQRDHTNSGPKK